MVLFQKSMDLKMKAAFLGLEGKMVVLDMSSSGDGASRLLQQEPQTLVLVEDWNANSNEHFDCIGSEK